MRSALLPFFPWLLTSLFFLGVFLIVRFLLPPLRRSTLGVMRRVIGWLLRRPSMRRWTASNGTLSSFKSYSPVTVVLLIGAILTFWAGDLFLDLVELLHSKSVVLTQVDTSAYAWAKNYRTPSDTQFFTIFTTLGGPAGLAVIGAAVSALLVWRHRYRWMGYLVVTSVGGALLNLALKAHFQRARPDLSVALRHARGFSFPSGHAMGSMIVASALAYVGIRAFPLWKTRALIVSLAVTFVALVGLSRIYLGVHWLSDIGAGWAAGGIWATFTTAAYEAVRRIRRIRGTKSGATAAVS